MNISRTFFYVTEEILEESLLQKQSAEAFLAMFEGKAVGYAIYFMNFELLGRAGMYLRTFFCTASVPRSWDRACHD